MDGVLNLNKPRGLTSHDIVDGVRRILDIRRVGHAGSLDPLATGVLLVCVGQATRIAEFLVGAEKEYRGVMTLGVVTDTEDSSGAVLSDVDASHVTEDRLREALPRFVGEIQQIPPMVSAVHHEGTRLYKLARMGEVVDRKPRRVEVSRLDLLRFEPGVHPRAEALVVCSKGVYIRTLFSDVGAALGVGAHMSELTRTRVGGFTLEGSLDLEDLSGLAEKGKAAEAFISMVDALSVLPRVSISGEEATLIRHGRSAPAPAELWDCRSPLAIILRDGSLLAVAEIVPGGEGALLRPTKVFA